MLQNAASRNLAFPPRIFQEIAQADRNSRFGWREVAALFGIQRREAPRTISRLKLESKATHNRVKRLQRSELLELLEPIKEKFEYEQSELLN
jgi:hypothetical protein